MVGSTGPSDVVKLILGAHLPKKKSKSRRYDNTDRSPGFLCLYIIVTISGRVPLVEQMFIETRAFDSTGHLSSQAVSTLLGPIYMLCALGWFDKDGNSHTLCRVVIRRSPPRDL